MNIYELDEIVKSLELNKLKNTNIAMKQFPNSPLQLETRRKIAEDTALINFYKAKRVELLAKIQKSVNKILNEI